MNRIVSHCSRGINKIDCPSGILLISLFIGSNAWTAEPIAFDDPIQAALKAEANGDLSDRTILEEEIEHSKNPEAARVIG